MGGEDGTIQGLLETLQVKYVGCGVFSSSASMDKMYTKVIFEKAGIPQAPYVCIKKKDETYMIINEIFEEEDFEIGKIVSKLKYPMFVKPSNSGSSIGITKVTNNDELKQAIEYASRYDFKILIEQGIDAREVECGILDGKEVQASTVGEIKLDGGFYDYDSKYNMPDPQIVIPAEIEEDKIEEVRTLAKKAFKAIDGKGLARIDFFIEKETNKVYINEINTLPGFTSISMYPQLFAKSGIEYSRLLDLLIENTQ